MDKKAYGLVLPKKKNDPKLKAKSIFESDSDENSDVRKEKRETPAKFSKTEAKHIAEDPSIYEYDSIYDSMKESSETKKQSVEKDRKPRFMSSLLKAADKRKKDQERRAEKKIHKERLNEGNEFEDKEAFVTSAYKNKMLEMEAEEEKERRKEKLDELMDVTKQKDLSGFYRHLLNQTTGEEKVPEFGETDKVISNQSSKSVPKKQKNPSDNDFSKEDIESRGGKKHTRKDEKRLTVRVSSQKSVDDSDQSKSCSSKKRNDPEKPTSPSHSRSKKRKDSESSDDSLEKPDQGKEKGGLKRKASADHEKQGNDEIISRRKSAQNKEVFERNESEKEIKESRSVHHTVEDDTNMDADEDIVYSDSENSEKDEAKDKRKTNQSIPKSDISLKFIKRTIGEVFEQAQERYFKRMAVRDSVK